MAMSVEEKAMERGSPSWLQAFTAMAYRQLLRFRGARSRVANAVIFPLMWLVFFGYGWSVAFNQLGPMATRMFGGLSYLEYLAPGIIVMTVFTGGFGSGLGVIWDREFGYLKEILVSPAPRSAVLLGRITGDTLATMIQGTLMALLVSLAADYTSPRGILAGLAAALVAAYASASIGTLIALSMKSPEGFHMVVNLVMMPMLFLSGAFYPLDPLPGWVKAIAYVNPLTYAVDLTRGLMYGVHTLPLALDALGLAVVTGVFTLAAVAKFSKTYIA
ncbi:putative daunorubicin resistance ABC transporter inner membrane subunit B [Pyrodictium delaneyi]|nr:ABC transporter permease [Pyrodictium delaneyi]ALL00272.1 putative daunorubicin resistance ABC transporter inner membrane subunit B [Pyrodictium delaneyi]